MLMHGSSESGISAAWMLTLAIYRDTELLGHTAHEQAHTAEQMHAFSF
jgi:hypothetical protein